MEDKNLTPQDENTTPEVVEVDSTSPAEENTVADSTDKANTEEGNNGGFMAFFKEKKALVIVLAVVAVLIVCGIAIALVGILGVDTSVATPDESTVETTLDNTTAPTTEAPGMEDTTWPDGSAYEGKQDWKALKDINTDIKGWVTFKNNVINYPVVKSEEDGVGYQYYIHRAYDKSNDYAGSIFIDYRSSEGVKSKNILTHGQSQSDGTMYMSLIDYGKYEPDMEY